MRHSYKLIILSFFLIGLASCKPRKAMEFKEAIMQKERVAFNILVGKNGSESKKLDFLIQGKYDEALATVNKQEKEFNDLIKDIEVMPTEGFKQGNELKAAAIHYYAAVKELQVFDSKSIINQKATRIAKGKTLDSLLKGSLEISLQKQEIYKKVHEGEEALYNALNKFNSANGID